MNKNLLRWLTIILPILFWIVVFISTEKILNQTISTTGLLVSTAAFSLGVIPFSKFVFSIINRHEIEIQNRANQLSALNTASAALNTELELTQVLRRVVELSCELVSAKAGGLGIWDETLNSYDQLITFNVPESGYQGLFTYLSQKVTADHQMKYGAYASVISSSTGENSKEVPPGMHSILALPVLSKGSLIANLHVFDKTNEETGEISQKGFTSRDQDLISMFATQAAIAIENARLYRQVEELAILQERERFGMDLHDGIIQSIYAVGLNLENSQRKLQSDPDSVRSSIGNSVISLNDVISDLRNYILDLRPERFQGRDLNEGIQELVRSLKANTFMTVNYHISGWETGLLNPEKTVELLHIVQEALTNIRKHAKAHQVDIFVSILKKKLSLLIEDDGIGFQLSQDKKTSGQGIRNIKERAVGISADLKIQRRKGGGTTVKISLPL